MKQTVCEGPNSRTPIGASGAQTPRVSTWTTWTHEGAWKARGRNPTPRLQLPLIVHSETRNAGDSSTPFKTMTKHDERWRLTPPRSELCIHETCDATEPPPFARLDVLSRRHAGPVAGKLFRRERQRSKYSDEDPTVDKGIKNSRIDGGIRHLPIRFLTVLGRGIPTWAWQAWVSTTSLSPSVQGAEKQDSTEKSGDRRRRRGPMTCRA